MKKRITSILAMLMVLAFVLSACGGTQGDTNAPSTTEDGQAKLQDTLTIATAGDTISLDPVMTNDNQSANTMMQIYEGLVKLDDNNEPVPSLAEKFEQPDDSTYVFYLKKGIKFHNGEELKASDVVFSLKRAIESAHVKHLFNTIDINSVKANDDYTVEFKMQKPYSGIVYALCHPGGFIVNEKAVTEAGDSYAQNPVGTGPMKFVSWSKANQMVMERFDDYHGDKASYKTLTFRVIPEPTNRMIELESGGVDMAYDISSIDLPKIEGNNDLQLFRTLDYGTTYLGFNCQKAPFDNPKVREAISYAIDLEGTIKAVWLGVGKAAPGPLPETLAYSISGEKQPKKRDIEKAKALLKEAGFENGFQTTLSTNERKERVEMATVLKEQLSEVGIDLSINVLEWSAYNDLLKNAQQDMFMIAWIADSPDPDTFIYPCFHSSAAGEGGNYAFFKDDEVDKLLDEARVVPNGDERGKIYRDAQERIMELNPWVPMYNGELLVGAKASVEGMKLSPFGWYLLNEVKIPTK